MAEAKLAPNMPDWMVAHANRYIASGGTEGHMYKINVPGRGEITAPALLLTTTGRKSGEKFIFPLFYGADGDRYFIVASKGGAPEHPGWYSNILADADVEVQVGTKKVKAHAETVTGEERARLWEKALEFWPPYADYQTKTEREIPVVVLTLPTRLSAPGGAQDRSQVAEHVFFNAKRFVGYHAQASEAWNLSVLSDLRRVWRLDSQRGQSAMTAASDFTGPLRSQVD